ncbi:hypothetical protein GCM10022217_01940 [Chryseobacterium ginsenosidimutans]|uniref:hypothetical protein n=1 Tax=Chryseobacterium ginsenosidimutans TaxID=687846 RepID=UPI0031CF4CC9
MNNQLFIIIFWILAFSCKAPVSSLYQDRVIVVSAQKTDWFGGRPGVRGTVYTVTLKPKNSRDNISVTSLKAEGNTISFTQTNSGNMITIKGNLQSTDQADNFENAPSGSTVENPKQSLILDPKDNWIVYTINNSKKTYKINIPKFVSVEPEGELIPRRQ